MSILTIVYKWSQSVSGFSLTQIPKATRERKWCRSQSLFLSSPFTAPPKVMGKLLWTLRSIYRINTISAGKNIKYTGIIIIYTTIIIKYTGIIITDAMISWNVLGYEEEEDYKNCCQYKSVGQHRWCRSWSWLMTINTASDKLSEHKLLKTKKIIACAVTYWFPTTGGSRWNQSLD